MLARLFKNITRNQVELPVDIVSIISEINNLYIEMEERLANEELQHRSKELSEQIRSGTPGEFLLPEAYALVKLACRRVLGIVVHDVQLYGAIMLYRGHIAEMKTGEGKTVTAVFPAFLQALEGHGVHIATVNEYLAERDSRKMGDIFRMLGLTVGCIIAGMSPAVRKAQYLQDVIYSTHVELGFDYLRDHLVLSAGEKVQRGLYDIIIDEVDSILIDEARTPLIISAPPGSGQQYLFFIDEKIKKLSESHVQIVESHKHVVLTEEGMDYCENLFSVDNLTKQEHSELYHYIVQALRANYVFKRDVDYVIIRHDDGSEEAVIIDPSTGRPMLGRRFMEGLHQAIEAKEGILVQGQPKTLATITLQSLFAMYAQICGMTGTAMESKDELRDIYGIDVVRIPTHRPVIRKDLRDLLFFTEEAKFNRVIKDIRRIHETGQPVLVGTADIKRSEYVSSMLTEAGIPHRLLNAKHIGEEAKIIEQAGAYGAVTIATNMAGRGVDIKLEPGVKELGGLYVLGTSRHESSRIDNQLRGRSGRQGDPGYSRFYASLEDEMLWQYYPERLLDELEKANFDLLEPIPRKRYFKGISDAQKQVESQHVFMRKQLLAFDCVLNLQRLAMYSIRDELLETEEVHAKLTDSIPDVILNIVEGFFANSAEPLNFAGIMAAVRSVFPDPRPLKLECQDEVTADTITVSLATQISLIFEEITELCGEGVHQVERQAMISSLDLHWMNFIEAVEDVKKGVGLQAYGNMDPYIQFEKEISTMFEEMMHAVRQDSLRNVWLQLQRIRPNVAC